MTKQAVGSSGRSGEGNGAVTDSAARLTEATVNGWAIIDDSPDRVAWSLGRTTAFVERISEDIRPNWRARLERESSETDESTSTVRLSHDPVTYEQAVMLVDIYMTERTVVPPRFSGGQTQAEWLREHVGSFEYTTAIPDDYQPRR
jgi:hypothetical protein